MTLGAYDNGLLFYADDIFVTYIPYSVWGCAKRARIPDGRRVWDVLTDIFYTEGPAGSYFPSVLAARDAVHEALGELLEHDNPHMPPGGCFDLWPGRHGRAWALYHALCALASACEIHPEMMLSAEQICENHTEAPQDETKTEKKKK